MSRVRLAAQWVFGLFFLWLFLATGYHGTDVIAYPVNAFFRIDPLAGLSASLASRSLLPFFWPLLLLLPLTFLFGRFFCGWICPLGSGLDLFGRKSRVQAPAPPTGAAGRWYWTRDLLLVGVVAASVAGLGAAGFLDPISLLIRTLTLGVLPPLEAAVRWLFEAAYGVGGVVAAASEPVYSLLRERLLSFEPPAFRLSLLFLLLGGALVWAEMAQRRFWCRNLCPAGALLALVGARPPLGLAVDRERCTSCGRCATVCPMGACEREGEKGSPYRIRPRDCTACHRCVGECPVSCIGHRPAPSPVRDPLLSLSRRGFLASLVAGLAAPAAALALPRESLLPADLIRPPGSRPEKEFLSRCVRCGECMKVCLTNGLHPAGLEAGIEGAWTPRFDMRQGFCEYSCTLCGQVCPTDAIVSLDPVAKRRLRIGTAVLDRDLCIPYLRPQQCMVCEEHCPTPEKAIVFDDVTVLTVGGPVVVKRPRVLPELCIGCGICEAKCPLQGRAAIRVIRDGEDRARG